ncbi:hypothetical protein NLJ89_g4167 [Agrocybe chaxingu]|uniref:HNH nuclease domain-containing protein n=1 Tax=Agrocybe chaxingu TaxID=84603 RepID=A0A9W8K2M5_9AGAR|nr:hypothetical protein NLJ89_g4167 [Agrocybe chaxingu]
MDDNALRRLPASAPERVQHVAHVYSAYNILLRLEGAILGELESAQSKQANKTAKQNLMYCRIVGHFFHHVPTDGGLEDLVREVSSTGGNDVQLLAIGQLYFEHFLRFVRSTKSRTPAQSCHQSRPSFSSLADMIEDAAQSHQTAKDRALVRDGFRCIISGKYDLRSAVDNVELQQIPNADFALTHCAHILVEAGVTVEGSAKANSAASPWSVLSRFGYEKLPEELDGAKNHRLENVVTLEVTVHSCFESNRLWLVPTNVPNQYRVEGRFPFLLRRYPSVVTFTTADEEKLPLPSRDYLAIHAACAKVAHLSGASEYIDTVLRETEETNALAEDGSSANALEHAILAAQCGAKGY